MYAVSDDRRVAMRPVRIERVEGELALVADGLSQGESVVTEGQSRLRAGARVQPRSSNTSEAQPGDRDGPRSPRVTRGDGGAQ